MSVVTAASEIPEPDEPRKVVVDGRVREASVPPLVPRVARGSLADLPYDNARQDPEAVLFSRKDAEGRWYDVSASRFAAEVHSVAKGLVAAGLRPGDRLALMARTTYEWTLIDFAAWAAGLVTVPVHPTSSAFQTRWILQDSGAAACVVEDAEQARLVSAERRQLPGLTQLWVIRAGAVEQLREAGRRVADETVTARRGLLAPEALATLVYTSGTTGRPKGCALTHANFFAEVDNAVRLLHPVFVSESEGPAATLLFLPLSHVFGRMVAVGCVRARVRVGHAPTVEGEELLTDLAGFRPTFLLAIPYVLEKVFDRARATAERGGKAAAFDRAARIARRYGREASPPLALRAARALYDPLVYRRIRNALGGRVKYVICGGAPLGARLAEFFAGAGVQVFEGYGLTETTAASTVTPPRRPRPGTVGRPLPGTAVRIADDGEVWLRGGHVFAGYWDAQRGAALPYTDDGWFPTGDLGSLDADGYLRITGRKKDVIVTSAGKNVAPAPLEDWLRAHPLVAQCMVLGDGRPYVTALITLDHEGLTHWRRMRRKDHLALWELARDPELLAALQRGVDDANRLVSRAESIRAFRVLNTEFSEASGHLTPSLKLKRRAVLRDFARDIEEMYGSEGARP
ncbi:long-chain acyl-CoA synthetase [Streptomyces sp. PanSC19]|uniref:AMP-dependent synthetase/ligase n=1 Tax=Streptomyces sp. PanSC19 TaxID=1520455 RepID=UPI000F49813C|nr:AMP-dependent synthetase/ligase [Streptomyces sp. PanSC19]ROQ24483.1 long-chain acyl-CoA synthetase [Streptomyces sp. PanSC19]